MKPNIKKGYEILKREYGLPNFDEINNEFEISLIEHEDFIIREIKNRIFDKIDSFTKFIEQLLQPDTNSITEVNEYRFIDDKERTKLFEFYKNLMNIHREIVSLTIENNDIKTAAFIKKFFNDWPKIKNQMTDLSKKLSKFWLTSLDAEFSLDYLG